MPRRPPHFKVFASIQNHRHTLGVFDDDALLAMYVRAGILAIERYADRTGDSFLLAGRDLERVAGCGGVANARRKLGRLEAGTRLTVCQEGAGYRLTFPNLAKKQFGRDGNGTETGPPSTTTSTTTSTKEKKEPAAVAAPAVRKAKTPRSPPSDWSLSCSDLLIEQLESVPGAMIPRGARVSWAREMERLVRECPELQNASIPSAHIAGAIRWALGPQNLGQEYEVVIRSGRALREKWPKLRAASRRVEAKRVPTDAEFEQQILDRLEANRGPA